MMLAVFLLALLSSRHSSFAFLPPTSPSKPATTTARVQRFFAVAPTKSALEEAPSSTFSTTTKHKATSQTNTSSQISADALCSSIIQAALYGAETIRDLCSDDFMFTRDAEGRSLCDIADTAAIRKIISSLLYKYPTLKMVIVGDDDDDIAKSEDRGGFFGKDSKKELHDDLISLQFHLPSDMAKTASPPEEFLDLADVTVYINNPLDAVDDYSPETMEDNNAVQCMIGVTYKNRPLMGAIGMPFAKKSHTSDHHETEVIFGLVGKGAGKAHRKGRKIVSMPTTATRKPFDADSSVISVSSSFEDDASASVAERLLAGCIERQEVIGCGNQLLQVAFGDTTLAVLEHDKTFLWDTAAPAAIITALGGRVTDYFGDELVYSNRVLQNTLGVVASAPGARAQHLEVTAAMRGDQNCLAVLEKYGLKNDNEDLLPQCVDIVRDLNGYPLDVNYFAQKLGIQNNATTTTTTKLTYACPETDAFRGLMSNACRVRLFPSGKTAFYKRIVFEHLDHAQDKLKSAPYKLISDAKSYKVVTSFLQSKACRGVCDQAGVHIPKLLDAQLAPNNVNPIESKFSFLLEDLDPLEGWSQRWLLQDVEECKAALQTYAKIHAFFWHGSNFWQDKAAGAELEAAIWKSGSYVQPSRNLGQCQKVAEGWATHKLTCEKELSNLEYWDDLGERLESIAETAGRQAHPFANYHDDDDSNLSDSYQKYRTFTHGDPKQANLLFRRTTDYHEKEAIQVGLIDFQWSGFGLAASDVAHFLTAAVHADRLEQDGEEMLLRYYFDELQTHLLEFGAFGSAKEAQQKFSYETFQSQYETAVLDICRLVIAYTWKRFEPVEPGDDQAGYARTFNKNSYSKWKPNVVWLMSRCNEIMKSRGI